MTRLNLVLLAALLVSGLVLVNSAYDARQLFTALDVEQREARRLDAEQRRLDAERQAQATPLRVEKVARERLRMRSSSAAYSHYIEDPGAQALPLRAP